MVNLHTCEAPLSLSGNIHAGRYYLVTLGRIPGIYDSQPAANAQVINYSGNSMRAYCTLPDAQEAWRQFCRSIHRGVCHVTPESPPLPASRCPTPSSLPELVDVDSPPIASVPGQSKPTLHTTQSSGISYMPLYQFSIESKPPTDPDGDRNPEPKAREIKPATQSKQLPPIVYVDTDSDEDSEDWVTPAPSYTPPSKTKDASSAVPVSPSASVMTQKEREILGLGIDTNFRLNCPPGTTSGPSGSISAQSPSNPATASESVIAPTPAPAIATSTPRAGGSNANVVASSSRDTIGLSPGRRREIRAAVYPSRIAPVYVTTPTYYAVRGRRLVIFRSRLSAREYMQNEEEAGVDVEFQITETWDDAYNWLIDA